MPAFFDTHTHTDFLLAQTGESLVEFTLKCIKVDVFKVMLMGVHYDQFKNIIQLCHTNNTLFYYTLGLHPLYLKQHNLSDLEYLSALAQQDSKYCVGIGEIGLDKYIKELTDPIQWKLQCEYFNKQLQIAEKLKLPVSIHARHCHNEIYSFIKKYNISGIIHGFSGSYQEAKRYIDIGFSIGVGSTITYPRATKTRTTISQLPLDVMVLETDAPDMPLNHQQGKPNHPANIPLIFDTLQSLVCVDPDLLKQQLWYNSLKIFNIDN
ncbi:MAG: TatD family deoxyribonuclease [Neisseriaceae bacterium]|nr:MAG: TatD family deoxyribonuclease [Neisseriaceae bacterium]